MAKESKKKEGELQRKRRTAATGGSRPLLPSKRTSTSGYEQSFAKNRKTPPQWAGSSGVLRRESYTITSLWQSPCLQGRRRVRRKHLAPEPPQTASQ